MKAVNRETSENIKLFLFKRKYNLYGDYKERINPKGIRLAREVLFQEEFIDMLLNMKKFISEDKLEKYLKYLTPEEKLLVELA